MTIATSIIIREEQPADRGPVRDLLVRAFEGTVEADLVDRLRGNCQQMLSFVAAEKGTIVGHLLLTPAEIDGRGGGLRGWALAPMAVHPDVQRRGIGSLLVETCVTELRRRGAPFLVVLGHSHFYPRFGFEPACRWRLRSEWDVPDEAFMVLALDQERLKGLGGMVRYLPEFGTSVEDSGEP